MNPMKKKTMRIMLSLLLVTVLVSAFSMTAFAAGDVAGEKIGYHLSALWSQNRFRMKLQAVNRIFSVFHCHDFTVLRNCCNF